MGNDQPTTFTLKQIPDETKNISFGGKKEEEMIQKFNTFDILWYAPENSEKLENWIAFTNVNVTKISDEEKFVQMAIKSRYYNLIIITTGSFGEKTIPLISPELLMPNIIIYCMDLNYHKNWSSKYKSIVQVSTHPEQIFECLLKIQEEYNFPSFYYNINYEKQFKFNNYVPVNIGELKYNDDNFSLKLNKYEKFCVKALRDYRLASEGIGNYFEEFMNNSKEIFNLFYRERLSFFPNIASIIAYSNVLNFNLLRLTLISLYFSKFPFLFGVLNYEEIQSLLKENLESNEIEKVYSELSSHLHILYIKLTEEKVSILDEIEHLKYLQIFLIKYCKYYTKKIYDFDDIFKFPSMIKCFEDLDFCLKYFFFRTYGWFKDQLYKMRCRGALDETDKRIPMFYIYSSFKRQKEDALKLISQEELKTLNQTLIIKDFIVIGNNNFHNTIKTIESQFIHRKIGYLSMEQVRDYLKNKNENCGKYRNFSYMIIIEAKNVDNCLKELYSIKNDFSLIIMLIIYTADKRILINKKILQNFSNTPIFIANDINEIQDFIISQENCDCVRLFFFFSLKMINILTKITNHYFPKNAIEQKKYSEKLNNQDGWN